MRNGKEKFTVLIADDHAGVRKGIRNIIEKGDTFEVIGEAINGKEAVELAQKTSPDLLILDVKLPLLRGEDVAKKLHRSNPEIKILALSSFDNPEYILGMIENGASGYLTKEEAPDHLQSAAKDILENKTTRWLSNTLLEQTGINFENKLSSEFTLSRIEHQILTLLKAGNNKKEIASELGFSSERIRKYIKIIILKFDANSLADLLNQE